jgi:2-iminobutanoate/2-iminopropanoate deaminase
VGLEPGSGELVEGGVAEQTDRALRNLTAILDAAGASLDRVVKTTVFLADLADFAAMNDVYAQHFSSPFPARSTVAVNGLPKGALVEIEAIAVAEDGA